MHKIFHKIAAHISRFLGSTWGFVSALTLMVLLGFYIGFTEKWTVESCVVLLTFLFLFFIQHSQNVSDKATHLKLDEIIRALEGARNEFRSVEETDEPLMDELKQKHPELSSEQSGSAPGLRDNN